MYWASWGVCWINPKFGCCSLFPSWLGYGLISTSSYTNWVDLIIWDLIHYLVLQNGHSRIKGLFYNPRWWPRSKMLKATVIHLHKNMQKWFLCATSRGKCWGPPSILSSVYQGTICSEEMKRLECDAYHSIWQQNRNVWSHSLLLLVAGLCWCSEFDYYILPYYIYVVPPISNVIPNSDLSRNFWDENNSTQGWCKPECHPQWAELPHATSLQVKSHNWRKSWGNFFHLQDFPEYLQVYRNFCSE